MPQSLSKVMVHVVYSTFGRVPVFSQEIREELHPYMATVLRDLRCVVVDVGGFEDHVHLLFSLPRTASIATIVEKSKTGTTAWIRRKWPHLRTFAWQAGYGSFSVGSEEYSRVLSYVRNQEEHHKKVSFKEEYLKMLKEHGVEYDERYLWD